MTPESRSDLSSELAAHAGFLARLARELVGEPHAAADLVQETTLVALDHPPRAPGSIRGWLRVVATNLAHNARRGDGRRRRREEGAARPEAHEDDRVALERLEVQRVLVELVTALPPEQRTVLHLRYFEDLGPTEIARRLDVPVKTVKTRQTRALAALRARLDARSDGDRGAWLSALLPFAFPRAAAPTAAALTGLAGVVAMKKVVVAVAVVLLAVVGWRVARTGASGARAVSGRSLGEMVAAPAFTEPAPEARPLVEEHRAVREPVAVPALVTGGLRLTFVRPGDVPASDLPFALDCLGDPAPRVEPVLLCTDENGTARADGLFAGDVRIRVGDVAYFDAEVEAGVTREVRFELPSGTEVRGTVVDAGGRPVTEAGIWWEGRPQWPSARPVTVTDASGAFRLEDLGLYTTLEARCAGHRPSASVQVSDMLPASDGAREVTLVLGPPGACVRGRVLDPEGTPLAGARVIVGPDREKAEIELPGGVSGMPPLPAPVFTDDEGRFVLASDLEGGTHRVDAVARGFPAWTGTCEAVAGTTVELEIRLLHPARVEGRVVDGSGAPVADLEVIAAEEDRGGWYHPRTPPSEARTDEEGRFALDWLPAGTVELNAHDYRRPDLGRARATVECVAGETTTCELVLELGRTIAGRVVDEDGAPLAGWRVGSDTSGGTRYWYPRSTTTDARGEFLLVNLGAGRHDLEVKETPFEHPRARVTGVEVGSEGVTITVPGAHAVEGRFVGRVVAPAERVGDLELTVWKVGMNEGHYIEIDAAGRFESGVRPGRYYLRLSRSINEDLLTSPEFEVLEGGTTDLGDLVAGALGAVEVELVGFPVEHLRRMRFSLQRAGVSSVELEWDGELLTAEDVVPGEWKLAAWDSELVLEPQGGGGGPVVIEVRSGEVTRATAELKRSVRVSFLCRASGDGELVVEAHDAAGNLLRRLFDPPDGNEIRGFSLGLPPGTVRVHVSTEDGLAGEVTVDVGDAPMPEPIVVELR